jgi:hypothetical protein
LGSSSAETGTAISVDGRVGESKGWDVLEISDPIDWITGAQVLIEVEKVAAMKILRWPFLWGWSRERGGGANNRRQHKCNATRIESGKTRVRLGFIESDLACQRVQCKQDSHKLSLN